MPKEIIVNNVKDLPAQYVMYPYEVGVEEIVRNCAERYGHEPVTIYRFASILGNWAFTAAEISPNKESLPALEGQACIKD